MPPTTGSTSGRTRRRPSRRRPPARGTTPTATSCPQCDLQRPDCDRTTAPAASAALDNPNFFGFRDSGSVRSTATVVSPALLSGWNVRPFDWQFAASVQQQVLPRRVGGIRLQPPVVGQLHVHRQSGRRAGGLRSVPVHGADRLATCPRAARQLNYLLLKPAAFGRVDNYLALASDYADPTVYWQGLEMTVNARMSSGLTLQGGFTTGGGVRDLCELAAAAPRAVLTAGLDAPQQGRGGVPHRGALAVGVARTGQLHRAEDGRAGQRHHAVAAERAGHQRPGVERPVAERQLLRAGGQRGRAARAPGRGQRAAGDARPGAARRRLPGSPQHGGHAGVEDPAHRPLPRQRGLRPLQPVQRQHRGNTPGSTRTSGPTAPRGCGRTPS